METSTFELIVAIAVVLFVFGVLYVVVALLIMACKELERKELSKLLQIPKDTLLSAGHYELVDLAYDRVRRATAPEEARHLANRFRYYGIYK